MKKIILSLFVYLLSVPVLVSAHGDEVHSDELMYSDTIPGFHMFGSGAFSWFGYVMAVIWLVIGVLVIVWLWQKINKK
ncbi:MAG: hypothetical protein Q8P83_03355 [bacterium]|nr:hypothetical protein [bacterium]